MTTTRTMTRAKRVLLLTTTLLTIVIIAAQARLARGQGDTGLTPNASATRTRLGLSGERFTLNGAPTFLLGVSYFDARHWHAADLDALQQRGYNLIRIWLDWRDRSCFDPRGRLTDAGREQLLALVDAADRRGIVVDMAILDTDVSFGRAHAATAVTEVASALADRTNVLYDLVNEYDHPGGPFTLAEVGRLAGALRAADPDALYGVSGGPLVRAPATVNAAAVQGLLADPLAARVLMPHLPRTADWVAQTGPRVRALRDHLQSINQPRPVYLQEEARRGHSGLNPTRDEFVRAARAARDAGAAGWVFHTDAGFTLDQQAFMAALDEVERAVLDALPGAVGLRPAPPPPTQPPAPSPSPAPSTPVGPAPFAVGARIEAEDARSAGERGTNGNAGTAPDYPNATGLDVNRCSVCSNRHSARLHWGEWGRYPVSVPRAGRYTVRLRAVAVAADRTVTVLVDGAPVVADLRVPPSASYNELREVVTAPLALPAGTRQIRVLAPKGMIVDWLQVEPAP